MENSINNLINKNNLLKGLIEKVDREPDLINTKYIFNIFQKHNIINKHNRISDFLKTILSNNYTKELYEECKNSIPKEIIQDFLISKSFIYFNDYLKDFLESQNIPTDLKKDHRIIKYTYLLFKLLNIQLSESSHTKVLLEDIIYKVHPYVKEFINVYNNGCKNKIYNDMDFYRFLFVKIMEINGEFKYSFPNRNLLSLPDVLRIIKKDCENSISRDKIINLINLLEIPIYNIPKIERSIDFNSDPKNWLEICETYIYIRKDDIKFIKKFLENHSKAEIKRIVLNNTINKIIKSNYGINNKNKYYEEINNKRKNTILEKYGGYAEITARAQASLIKKYGTSNINKLEWKKEKTRKTVLNKYGAPHISQTDYFKEKIKDTYAKNRQKNLEYLQSKYNKNLYDFKDLVEKFGYTNPENLKIAAERIGISLYKGFKYSFIDEDGIKNLKSYINSPMSSGEFFISKFLEENNIKFIHNKRFENCRDKLSLPFDFYLPDYNVCIEYQGEQHFKEIPFLTYCTHDKKVLNKNEVGLEERQHKDNIKKEFCKNNNIKLLEPAYYHSNEEIKMIIIEALNLY